MYITNLFLRKSHGNARGILLVFYNLIVILVHEAINDYKLLVVLGFWFFANDFRGKVSDTRVRINLFSLSTGMSVPSITDYAKLLTTRPTYL